MQKFRGKYRIETARLKGYDYSSNGAYFITICTKNRKHFFGEIVDGEMVLNKIGVIVWDEWLISEKIRKNIILDKFVVMPNHIHGIVIINNPDVVVDGDVVDGRDVASQRLYGGNHKKMSNISPKKTSLSHMVRELKSAITRKSREINPNFGWQSRFHDHIIRDKKSLNNIQQYIIKNPQMWERDRNKQGLWS